MPARLLHHTLAPIAVACLGIALFTVMDAIMKGLAIALGAYNAMLWRTVAGMVLLTPLYLWRVRRVPGRATLWLHLWRGVAAAISVLLFFWGLVYTPLAQGIALSFIAPLIALALAGAFLKERIGPRALGGAVLAFVGVLFIVAGRAGEDSGANAMAGAVAILVAAVFYAVNLVLSRRQSQSAGPLEVAFFFNLVAMTIYGTGAPWLARVPDLHHVGALLAAACSSSIALMLLAWAYARAEAQYLVTVEYTGFIWAALLGWILFREPVGLVTLFGALLIVAGCLLAMRRGKPRPLPLAVDPGDRR